MTTEWIALR